VIDPSNFEFFGHRERSLRYAIGPNRYPTPLSVRTAGDNVDQLNLFGRRDLNRGPHHYEYGKAN
jgi:hypothetical protein